MKKMLIPALALALLAGCATTLTPEAEKINLVSQKENCEKLKLITFTQSLGPDKPGNALKGALNEAAGIGANSFYIISSTSHPFDGASVIGEALRCK